MKTLYLHIGTPKTATTAIQGFCTDNYDVLSGKGYAYPSFPYRYPNVVERRNAHFLIDYKPTSVQPTDFEKSDEVWKEAFSKIYELFETHDNVILSDEAIWNFGCRMDYRVWKKLKEESEAGNFTVKVIVYFRRQDEFMFSWWNQQVKEGMHGNSVLNWAEMAEKKAYIQLDYYDILENIASYVGKENIMVRLFDRSKFFGGTIYADFMHCIGLEFTDEYEIKAEVRNISLTKNNIEIKRMLNSLPGLDNKSNVMFRKVLSELSAHNTEDKKTDMFSAEELAEFMAQYDEGNRKIAEEYMDGVPMFSMDSADEKWTAENDKMNEDILNFVGAVCLNLVHENENLRKELKAQKQEIKKIKESLKHPFRTVKNKMFK